MPLLMVVCSYLTPARNSKAKQHLESSLQTLMASSATPGALCSCTSCQVAKRDYAHPSAVYNPQAHPNTPLYTYVFSTMLASWRRDMHMLPTE